MDSPNLTMLEIAGFISAVLGIYTFARHRIAKAEKAIIQADLDRMAAEKDRELDNIEMAKILSVLTEHSRILKDLEDTLRHPDDSGFGVVWLRDEIQKISDLTQEVRDHMLERG